MSIGITTGSSAAAAAIADLTGQLIDPPATTYAGLPTADLDGNPVTEGDILYLSVADIGTGTAESPQYPAGFYAVDAAGVPQFSFAPSDRRNSLISRTTDDFSAPTTVEHGGIPQSGDTSVMRTYNGDIRFWEYDGTTWTNVASVANARITPWQISEQVYIGSKRWLTAPRDGIQVRFEVQSLRTRVTANSNSGAVFINEWDTDNWALIGQDPFESPFELNENRLYYMSERVMYEGDLYAAKNGFFKASGTAFNPDDWDLIIPVSYTHLTLPTIYSV